MPGMLITYQRNRAFEIVISRKSSQSRRHARGEKARGRGQVKPPQTPGTAPVAVIGPSK